MATDSLQYRALQGISERAHHLLRRFGSAPSKSTAYNPPAPTESSFITLPRPHSITRTLVDEGLPEELAERLSLTYIDTASRLKIEYERSMNEALKACINLNPIQDVQVIRSTFLKRYTRSLYECKAAIIKSSSRHIFQATRSSNLSARPTKRIADPVPHRASFKTELLPLLDEAFHRSAYPTRAEKAALAEKTGMELKQIHVWFQNRRSRLRKESNDSQKLSFVAAKNTSSSGYRLSETERSAEHDAQHEDKNSQDSMPPFSTVSSLQAPFDPFYQGPAAHAFPGPYPPTCDYDPFPLDDGPSLFVTIWPRQAPRTDMTHEFDLSDTDQVVTLFGDMTLTAIEEYTITAGGKNVHRTSPPCFPFLTFAPPAPLPALLHPSSAKAPSAMQIDTSQRHPSPFAARPDVQSSRRTTKSSPRFLREASHPYYGRSPHYPHLRVTRLSSSSSLSSICSQSSACSTCDSPSSIDSPLATPPQVFVDLFHPAKLSISTLKLDPISRLDSVFNVPGLGNPSIVSCP